MAGAAALELPLSVSAGDALGCSTAIVGDHIVVGACGDTNGAGAVHSIRLRSPTAPPSEPIVRVIEAIRAPDGGSGGAAFGSALALTEHHLVVGAPYHADDPLLPAEQRGAAYIWRLDRSGVASSPRRFLSDVPTRGVRFGHAVAVLSDSATAGRVVVGEPGLETYPAGSAQPHHNGFVFVFDAASGALLAKLSPLEPTSRQPAVGCFDFGASLVLSNAGGLLAVGSPRARPPCASGVRWGAAWVFELEGLTQTTKLTPPTVEGASRSHFGHALAWHHRSDGSGYWLYVGAPGFRLSASGDAVGAVYTLGPFGGRTATTALPPVSVRPTSRVMGTQLGLGNGNGRFGHAIAMDSASGLGVVGATTRFSVRGPATGGASLTRHWAVEGCDPPGTPAAPPTPSPPASGSTFPPPPPPPPRPPPPPLRPPAIDLTSCLPAPTPLIDVQSRFLWGRTTVEGDEFGASVALSSSGVVLIGVPKHSHTVAATSAGATTAIAGGATGGAAGGAGGGEAADAVVLARSGAAYLHVPPPPPPPIAPTAPPPLPNVPPTPTPPPPAPPLAVDDGGVTAILGVTAGVLCGVLVLALVVSVLVSCVQSARVRATPPQVAPPQAAMPLAPGAPCPMSGTPKRVSNE